MTDDERLLPGAFEGVSVTVPVKDSNGKQIGWAEIDGGNSLRAEVHAFLDEYDSPKSGLPPRPSERAQRHRRENVKARASKARRSRVRASRRANR